MLGPRRPFYKAGPVHAAAEDPGRAVRLVHRAAFREAGDPSRGRASGSPSSTSPVTCPYDVQRLAHETWDDARAVGAKRVGLEHLHITLRRLLAEQAVFFEADLAAAHAPAARVPPRARPRRRRRPPRGRRARAVSPGRRIVRAGGAGSAAAPGRRDARGRSPGGGGDAHARVDRAEEWTDDGRLAGAPRAAHSRAVRVGHERLGQLRVPVHDHHGRFPDLSSRRSAAGAYRPRTRHGALRTGDNGRELATATTMPVLGAYADYAGVKSASWRGFLGLGVIATAAMTDRPWATGSSPRGSSSRPTSASRQASS